MKKFTIFMIYFTAFAMLFSIWTHQIGFALLDGLCLWLNLHSLKRIEKLEEENAISTI